MIGELTIEGDVKPPEGRRFSTVFWPDMTLRVNHNPQLWPIGRVRSLVYRPDGDVQVTADIAWSLRALTLLSVAPGLGVGGRPTKAPDGVEALEIIDISILDYPANTPAERKCLWRVASGRLPRVIVEWAGIERWPGAEAIEQFEVGWHAHGYLIEVEPEYAIDDSVARMELRK